MAPTPPAGPVPPAARHLRASDLRGMVHLAAQATVGVSRIAEGVHQAVWSQLGMPSGQVAGRTRGVTGLAYRSVEGIARLVAGGSSGLLASLEPFLAAEHPEHAASPQRLAVLAALNGVLGDRLHASHNPLALPMVLRWQGTDVAPASPPPEIRDGPRLLLLLHGLCMNELQWQVSTPEGTFDHGALLGQGLQAPVLYLRYNSGRHISDNGADLAVLLEQLLGGAAAGPSRRLSVVAHSMGGLLIRSAVDQAERQGMAWPARLRDIVFLGTPHHGAPLERAGSVVDTMLGSTPWSRPFARLGHLRSAGITDLRHGSVRSTDWQGRDRFGSGAAHHQHVPLPEGVNCYTVAATLASQRSRAADRLVGDGLVPLRSALGHHDDPLRRLVFAREAQCIAWRTGHLALLRSPVLATRLAAWLA